MASWEGVGCLRDEMAYHWKQDVVRPQKKAIENCAPQCWPGKQEDNGDLDNKGPGVNWAPKLAVTLISCRWGGAERCGLDGGQPLRGVRGRRERRLCRDQAGLPVEASSLICIFN